MKELIPMDDYGVFADTKDTARANSLFVAEMFEKQHKDVLKAIRTIIDPSAGLSEEFVRRNFAPVKYVDAKGEKRPAYALTRDGFTLLAMGFTGRKAMQFKEAYIQRFNEMERHIATVAATRRDYPALTDAIKLAMDDPQPYHYSNEADMINRIITGYSAKQFREMHSIPKGESIRPYLAPAQLELMERLQKVDTGLLLSTPDFEQRKRLLEFYKSRWEQQRLTA